MSEPDSAAMLPLHLSSTDPEEVGGKAAQLVLLLRAGLPVPEGFVIPARVLDRALQSAGLGPEIEAFNRALHLASGDAPGAKDHSALLRQGADLSSRIRSLPLPPPLVRALHTAWHQLAAKSAAVRSSALQEDGKAASYAGQHETVLGVHSPETLVDAVCRCWASLFSETALRYRLVRGGADRWGMGVVVQRLLQPRASGVLFTVNPMNGSRREMVLDAGWGLGEAYVSGQAAADSFVLSRPMSPHSDQRLGILHQVIVPKPRMLIGDIDGAPRWVDVPQADRTRPTLSPSQCMQVGRLGLAAERLFAGPRDIEWALTEDDTLWVLQARPITTEVSPDTHRSRTDVLWTSRFSGERWTETASPLGWSIIAPILHHFVYFEQAAQAHLQGSLPTRLYRGAPYFNITIFRHLLFKMPGSPPPQFMLEFFPREEQEEILRAPWIWPNLRLLADIVAEVVRERRWERFAWQPLSNHRIWDAFLPGFERDIAAVPERPDSIEACQTASVACRNLIIQYIGIHVTSLAFASIFYQVLDVLVRRWAGRADPSLLAALVTQTSGNKTIETNRALWGLAQAAMAAPEILHSLTRDGPIPSIDELKQLQGGRAFNESLAAFLTEYGHRSIASWEIFSPRWEDDPGIPLSMIRSWLGAGTTHDPLAQAGRSDQERHAAEAQVKAAISAAAPLGRGLFRQRAFAAVLHLARSYSLLRENQRFYFDKLLLRTKRVLERQGELMTQQGLLEAANDIVFLTVEELQELCEGTLPPDAARALSESRRQDRRDDSTSEHPVFLRGEQRCMDASSSSGHTLTGLGISPGRITGKVRIIRNLAEGLKLRRGDILVTRATDPGWTPLFLTAGGLIMELGSVLSHGAVVAREYHLPAVVNISDATSRLKDGQTVTLDGDRGLIYLH